ncbi:MAG: DNA methyltransferase [Planctomycetaceae bacterium]|nr:DNA methyltransferase [Planctomycetaceae bacterium]
MTAEHNDFQFPFPATRYQGSKSKLTDWIWECIRELKFHTVLDAFGGTGCVSHMLKRKGKAVTYNDILTFNYIIGKGLIENDAELFPEKQITALFQPAQNASPFIQDTFSGIYFTDEENRQLDTVIANIQNCRNEYQRAIAYFALFQACIAKRPYNLFHRANLYVRLSEVKRTFGNKTTWDRPFQEHFTKYIQEANRAIFSNGLRCCAANFDVFDIPAGNYDLVYIDTPYISERGIGTNYLEFYHFLEGLANYDEWPKWLALQYKHKPIRKPMDLWNDRNSITDKFDRLFEKFQNSICVVSYRNNGYPAIEELCQIMGKYKKHIRVMESTHYQYVLSKKKSREVLLIGE